MATDSHSHDGSGDDSTGTGQSTQKLALVAVINFVGFAVELAGGILFGSVALISDALHMLFDMLAYVMAFTAGYAAERFESGATWSYGWHRLEPVAAFLNGVLLVPMVAYIVWESYQRFLARCLPTDVRHFFDRRDRLFSARCLTVRRVADLTDTAVGLCRVIDLRCSFFRQQTKGLLVRRVRVLPNIIGYLVKN